MSEIYQSVQLEGFKGQRVRVLALIDTGANINAISKDVAKKFYTKKEILSAKKIKINFTDNNYKYYPQIFLKVLVANESRIFPFIVMEEGFGTQVLLGVRFLQGTDKTIEFKNDKIRFLKLSKRKGNWW